MPNTFSRAELVELPNVISAPRFARYLRAQGGVNANALALYRWNLQISSAFIVPLQVCEVAVRNAVSQAISNTYASNWPWIRRFVQSLPEYGRFKPGLELAGIAAREATTGKVVAELNFMFWQKMITARHQVRIWDGELFNVFPHYPHPRGVFFAITSIHNDLEKIRLLRNRIAHHEPIFHRMLDDDYERIIRVISYINPSAAGWVHRVQTVTSLLASRP